MHPMTVGTSELARILGISRQRVNQALHTLEQAGLIRVEYGAIRIEDKIQDTMRSMAACDGRGSATR